MFNRVIVGVIGSSNSGKTLAIEAIISGLTKKGYKIATIKHIPKEEFTIDTPKKDTWRYSKAGADIILSVAPKEITRIKKIEKQNNTLEKIIYEIPLETDIIIIEGFKNLIGKNISIPKIVAVKNNKEISEALSKYNNILAFIGNNLKNNVDTKIKFFEISEDKQKLINFVIKKVSKLIERKRNQSKKINILINEQTLPLGGFVQDIIRNSVLAMVSSLKGAKIKGEEIVSIFIKRLDNQK
jgi:molybdopterin-guanine dinucleotide biosynthesis protein MobB